MFVSDVGFSALMAFMPILLNEIGTKINNKAEIYATVLAQTFLGIPGTILSAYLVTTWLGKRWTTAISYLLSGFFVFFFLFSNQYWMVMFSTCFIFFFDFMGYSSMMAIITESYSVNVKSIGVGWANGCNKFGGVISPAILGFIFESEGGIGLGVAIIALCFGITGIVSAFYEEPKRKQ